MGIVICFGFKAGHLKENFRSAPEKTQWLLRPQTKLEHLKKREPSLPRFPRFQSCLCSPAIPTVFTPTFTFTNLRPWLKIRFLTKLSKPTFMFFGPTPIRPLAENFTSTNKGEILILPVMVPIFTLIRHPRWGFTGLIPITGPVATKPIRRQHSMSFCLEARKTKLSA